MSVRKHIYPSKYLDLPRTLHSDRHKLEMVDVPVVTISATYKRDIAEKRGEVAKIFDEIVFSRAHYSMACGVVEQARLMKLSSWLVDPTNFVSAQSWRILARTERIGEIVARSPLLKKIKDIADNFIRSNIPIADVVKEPLAYVTYRARNPIISFHYESGNILSTLGKNVLQIVTDPHVRSNYLQECERKNIYFAVFDDLTRIAFLDMAKQMGKKFDKNRIFVTGPPVDPRIVKCRKHKKIFDGTRPLRIVVTASGLGTNKGEIGEVVESLMPGVKSKKIELILYASTHTDFKELFENILKINKVTEGVKILYHRSIVDANEDLIKNCFPWADCFITKPSGDMAYDAVASGAFFLSLEPWGVWEANIQKIFEKLSITRKAETSQLLTQIDHLIESGWVAKAQQQAVKIDKLYLEGAKKIVDLQRKLPVQ